MRWFLKVVDQGGALVVLLALLVLLLVVVLILSVLVGSTPLVGSDPVLNVHILYCGQLCSFPRKLSGKDGDSTRAMVNVPFEGSNVVRQCLSP